MRRIIPITVGVALAIFSLSYLIPAKQTAAERSPLNVRMQSAIGIAKACRVYSLDHDGRPPAALSDPEFVAELGADEWNDHCLYHDPGSGRRMEWLYFPDNFDKTGDESIFIASPITWNGRLRIVVFGDASGKLMKNEEFEAIYPSARPLSP